MTLGKALIGLVMAFGTIACLGLLIWPVIIILTR